MSDGNKIGLNQNKELYSGVPSSSNKLQSELPNIDLHAPGSSQHSILQGRKPDIRNDVPLEYGQIELYHFSRFYLEDGICIQEFLTRIDNEELQSLVLPGNGPFGKEGVPSLCTRPSHHSKKAMIGNKRANIPSTTEMAGKKDLPSPSSPEAVEDATIDDHSYCLKRKLGLETYLENPFFNSPLSLIAKENVMNEEMELQYWMKTVTPFDNSATKMVYQQKAASSLIENSQPSSKSRKIEVKSVPLKHQDSLLKTLLSKSGMKPKEVQEKPSENKQTVTRIYHGPLKSITNTRSLGHSSQPKKIKETALSIAKSKDQWFVAPLQSIPANGVLTVPILSESGAQFARLPLSILEKVNSFAMERKEVISSPICLQITSTSTDPNEIAKSAKPTGLVVLSDPQHPEKVFIGPYPAAYNGQFPFCLVPLNN